MVGRMRIKPVRNNVKVYEDRYRKYDPSRPWSGRRDVKTIIAETILGVVGNGKGLDPLTQLGATELTGDFVDYYSCPQGSETWESDPNPDCPPAVATFNNCGNPNYCGPVLLVFYQAITGSPSGFRDEVSTYAVPSVKASQSPCNKQMTYSGGGVIPVIPGGLKLKGVSCNDTGNKARFDSYSARDDSTRSYAIAALGLGFISTAGSAFDGFAWFNLPSAQTKQPNDIMYYVYRIGFYYG